MSMVLNKVAEIASAAVARLSAPKTSNATYTSSGLPPLPGSHSVTSLDQKNKLRLSSSLQDLSAYRRLDLDDGDANSEIERGSTNLKRLNLFKKENLGSSFSKEKGSPAATSARTKWTRVFLVLLCLLLVTFLLYVLFFYFNLFRGESKFYVVLDCGSTGTRVYVYEASPNYRKDGDLPIVLRSLPEGFKRNARLQGGRAYNRMETEPGFDKLVHNISGLKRAIKPLIRWAERQIPKNAHKTTSLYLYATAGVRRLPNSDSEWLLKNAWSILKSSPFLCQREWVKTITGMEEAYYGWIAMNYHTGLLGAIPKKETYGALDLGGSSLQVTFESKENLPADETSLELNIGAVNHHLTAYSLAGYGLNDAFDKSVVHLLKTLPKISDADLTGGNIEIKHPCLHSGYKEQYICTHCVSLYQEGGNPSAGREVSRKGGKPGVRVQLVGAPKWEECNSLAKIAVNLSEWSDKSPGIDCELQPCALAENLPRPFGQFYAMSGFFVVYQFFNLTPEAALDDVLEKGREFCDKVWDVARTSVAPQPFIEQYCFRAPYIVFLLREGLHITDRQVTIASGSITWTLGVALLEAGKMVSTRAEFVSNKILLMKTHPVIFFAILFASLAVLLCALPCVGKWMPRFRRPYLPLFRNNNVSSTSIMNIPAPFSFKRWSPVITGEARVKTPLSPTIANTQQRPFDTGHGFGGNGVQLTESSLYSSSSSVAHSFSSGSLQMPFESSTTGSFWSPHRSQQRLQSRRSQSREDLISSLAEVPLPKV